VHSLEAACATWTGGFDVVHFHAIGPALMSPIAKLRGRKVVVTVHGQDWRRQKWGRFASMALQAGEWAALNVPNATISVSKGLAERYAAEGHDHVTYIPNGVSVAKGNDGGYLRELGLKPRGYVLFAGRLVPEKGVHTLIAAHARLGDTLPLVIAGGSSHSDDYVAELRKAAEGRDVRFLGNVYGRKLATLFRNAGLFVLPSDLEGQPIVLLEALAYGAPIVASDIPENVEVLGDKGLTFRVRDDVDLAEVLEGAIADMRGLVAQASARRERAVREYDWSTVAAHTLEVYQGLVRRPHGAEERARAALLKSV
jgi:glycosyltransferase involved in cell wall biosynthesis